MDKNKKAFDRRKQRVRSKLKKSNHQRLTVFKSGQHIYAQIIDDSKSHTLVSASTLDKTIKKANKSNCNIESAISVGKLLAARAKETSIDRVVFDKGGYRYHGVIKALADEVRKQIQF